MWSIAVKIPRIGPSLGGVESLIEQPLVMSYFSQTPENRQKFGIPDNMIRMACGIENTQDLIDDLQQALEHVNDHPMKFRTRAIHVGNSPDPSTGAVIPPIHSPPRLCSQGQGSGANSITHAGAIRRARKSEQTLAFPGVGLRRFSFHFGYGSDPLCQHVAIGRRPSHRWHGYLRWKLSLVPPRLLNRRNGSHPGRFAASPKHWLPPYGRIQKCCGLRELVIRV